MMMMTRKHSMAVSHGGGRNGHIVGGGGHGHRSRQKQTLPATIVWSGLGQPALFVANGRKLVNPVNALSVNLRSPPPPPPPPPPPNFGFPVGSSSPGQQLCCSCCYCCCDSVTPVDSRSSATSCHSSSGKGQVGRGRGRGGGGGPCHDQNLSKKKIKNQTRSKSWRMRSKSKEKIIEHSHSRTPFLIDVRKLVQSHSNEGNNGGKTKFVPWTSLEDSQAIRCAEFHPQGRFYAVGSNSKSLRICEYPDNLSQKENDGGVRTPNVLYKKIKHHRGSIYSLGWSPDGNLLATGSNDKTVKLVRFDDAGHQNFNESHEVELTMHDGTVRDLCFIEDLTNKSSLLVSGGAGDCKIYVTDCVTATPFQAFPGHSAPILSLYNWGGVMFTSGSQDKTIRIWDLRSRACVHMFSPLTSSNSSTTKSAVGSVCVDPTGRLLVSGHEDGAVVLYDIRGSRQIQTFKPHGPSDVRSVRFSPKAYYLLSAGYDQRLMLTDLQGDLSLNLLSVPVASKNVIMKNGMRTINDFAHDDKIISARWHPTDFSFISTSADKTVKLWGLPNSL